MRSSNRTFPSERAIYTDAGTRHQVTRWTAPGHHDQHLYFTTSSVTDDGRWLVIISDRDGCPNLYAIARASGEIHRVSNNVDGVMRSYVYAKGGNRGLAKCSPCLCAATNELFYVHNGEAHRIPLDGGSETTIGEFSPGWWIAYGDVSPDGSSLCFPCAHPDSYPVNCTDQWQQLQTVPGQMAERKLGSRIIDFNVRTGKQSVLAEVGFWVTHVQFNPTGNGRMIFNREGHGELSRPRTWCLEATGAIRPLFNQPRGMICSHESWSADGKLIVYHGWDDAGPFIAARTWDGKLVHHHYLPGFSLGHIAFSDSRSFITDGIDGMITLGRLTDGRVGLHHLCRHGTDPTLRNQDAHAHPRISPDGKSVVFTSDCAGSCDVYEVAIGKP